MNSIHSTNKLRFRTYVSLVKGKAVSKKDSTVVRLNDGKWLCVRRNGETGRFKIYDTIEAWMDELPQRDGVICLTDEATRVERMEPGAGLKTAEPEPKPATITDTQISDNILRMMALADTCITSTGRVRCITELMQYLVSVPNYVRNNPGFRDALLEKCKEYMASDEFVEDTDFHHAVYQTYTTFV